jgi:DNA-directed RNA polymerase subunit RPC12/RpoP
MIDAPPSELAYRCADCRRVYYSSVPNLVERGARCPRCRGVLKRRAGNDRWSPSSKT